MQDVNGIEFEPKELISKLRFTEIYEDYQYNRHVVRRTPAASIQLEAKRKSLRMARKDFADHIGVSYSEYNQWVNGDRNITRNTRNYRIVANALDISVDEARTMLGVKDTVKLGEGWKN